MAETFDHITDQIAEFIARQHVFFVATAPGQGGRVNVSPKGYDTFRILGRNRVAYLDLTGSGVETVAHIRQNGRITFMFCAFEGDPMITRLYGTAHVLEPHHPEYATVHEAFASRPGERSIVTAEIESASTSCGWAVPFLNYVGERPRLHDEYATVSEEALAGYRSQFNRRSIDGLPALNDPAEPSEVGGPA
jgi:hypothetical protein